MNDNNTLGNMYLDKDLLSKLNKYHKLATKICNLIEHEAPQPNKFQQIEEGTLIMGLTVMHQISACSAEPLVRKAMFFNYLSLMLYLYFILEGEKLEGDLLRFTEWWDTRSTTNDINNIFN